MPNTQFRDNLPTSYARAGGVRGLPRPGIGEGLATAGLAAMQATGMLPTYGQVQDIATRREMMQAELDSERGRGGILGAQTNRINELLPYEQREMGSRAFANTGMGMERMAQGYSNLADARQTNTITGRYDKGLPHPDVQYPADTRLKGDMYDTDSRERVGMAGVGVDREVGLDRNAKGLEGVKFTAEKGYQGDVDVAEIRARSGSGNSLAGQAGLINARRGILDSRAESIGQQLEFLRGDEIPDDEQMGDFSTLQSELRGVNDQRQSLDTDAMMMMRGLPTGPTNMLDALKGGAKVLSGIAGGGIPPVPQAPDTNPEPGPRSAQAQVSTRQLGRKSLDDFDAEDVQEALSRGMTEDQAIRYLTEFYAQEGL